MIRRIALISEHASPLSDPGGVDSGGQNVYVSHVATQLASRGYEVDVFTRRDSEQLETSVCTPEGVRVISVPAGPARPVPKESLLPFIPEFTKHVMAYARDQRYDIVHANFWMSGLTATEIKRSLGIPFVITFHALGRVRREHQGADDGFPGERAELEERLMGEADRVIAECPQDLRDMTRLYRIDERRVSVVPCGFDPDELWPVDRKLARQKLGLCSDEPVLLQLGRMVPRKGVDTAIRAVARLRHSFGMNAELIVVGGDCEDPEACACPEIDRLRQIAQSEGIDDLVRFDGRKRREVLKYYYSAADAFITVPWYEPFGITPLEAMACGTPVIGSDVGGIKYSVVNGETGYLVPPRNPEAVAERLANLLDSSDLCREMGRKAAHRVNELFTWEKVVDGLSSIYEAAGRDTAQVVLPGSALSEVTKIPSSEDQTIHRGFDGAIAAITASRDVMGRDLAIAAEMLCECFRRGGKLLVCGNGGSAADSQHFVAELVGRFSRVSRPALPALALTADTAVLTAWANDVSFQDVFARQIEALGGPADVLMAISTSGRSKNVLAALETANRRRLGTIAMLGGDGGEARPMASVALVVPSSDTRHIQEVHLVLMHTLCDLVERHVVAEPIEHNVNRRISYRPRRGAASAAAQPRREGRQRTPVGSP
jgi:phosphoheptose isomerase